VQVLVERLRVRAGLLGGQVRGEERARGRTARAVGIASQPATVRIELAGHLVGERAQTADRCEERRDLGQLRVDQGDRGAE
jgi:hypothetical protein